MATRPTRARKIAAAVPILFVVGLAALIASVYAISIFSNNRTLVVALFGGALFAGTLFALGNTRLTVLYGLLLSAPLSIGKDFSPVPHMGGASSYAIVASDAFLAILVVFQLADRLGRGKALDIPPGTYALIVMILVGVLHTLFGPAFTLSSQQTFQMIKELILFVVVTNELVRARRFMHAFWILMLGLVVQSAIGIAQYLIGGDLGLQVLGEADASTLALANLATYGEGADVFRIGGLLGHPNLLAGSIALLLPLAVAMLASEMTALQRNILYAICAISGAALILTLSRSGWLSGAFGIFIVITFSVLHPRWRKRALPLTILTSAGGFAAAMVALPIIIQRFLNSDRGATDFRFEWMEVAWNFVVANPLTGVGLNTFVFQLPNNNPYGGVAALTQRFGDNWPVVHNIYLLVWSEMGTIGFGAFMFTMYRLLVIAFINLRDVIDPRIYAISIGCAGGLGAIMLDGMASFFLRNPQCARLFWIVAAMMVACYFWNRRNGPLRAEADAEAARQAQAQAATV
ncbi:MAG: O-antigen ligase family protein [Pseudomonadota bacterium]